MPKTPETSWCTTLSLINAGTDHQWVPWVSVVVFSLEEICFAVGSSRSGGPGGHFDGCIRSSGHSSPYSPNRPGIAAIHTTEVIVKPVVRVIYEVNKKDTVHHAVFVFICVFVFWGALFYNFDGIAVAFVFFSVFFCIFLTFWRILLQWVGSFHYFVN